MLFYLQKFKNTFFLLFYKICIISKVIQNKIYGKKKSKKNYFLMKNIPAVATHIPTAVAMVTTTMAEIPYD